jgi:hypothetical protein
MSENGSLEQSAAGTRRRTRRQMLAGGAAAVGVVATQLARATPAAAQDGNPILMGESNTAFANTSLANGGSDPTFTATAMTSATALEGNAEDGTGVSGYSYTGTAVSGTTPSDADNASAVYGEITTTRPGSFSAAVRGKNDGTGGDGIGVYGSHAGAGWAVYGESQTGTGVYGVTGTGYGVEGSGTTGVYGIGSTGVHGVCTPPGVGVLAENGGGGQALQVKGVAAFSRSGVLTVSASKSEVSRGLSLTSASFVLATIQANVTDLYVRGVTITTGSHGSFTIHLSKEVTTKTKVAWLAVN